MPSELNRAITSGVLLLAGWLTCLIVGDASTPPSWAAHALLWAALICGASTFVPGALTRLGRGRLGVGLLMTIAAVGAVCLGYVLEAAALAFLYSMAEALEDRAIDHAEDGLGALLSLIPRTAQVRRDGRWQSLKVTDVKAGDLLMVAAGERIPTDGHVRLGHSSLDVSAVTGESLRVTVAPGEAVLAGCINTTGVLQIEATASGRDNSLTRIVALVQDARITQGRRARLADRIAAPLVPGVLMLALGVALIGAVNGDWSTWIERALVVLVAASPCALAIAVPVTVISAIGAATRGGMVIKSGAAFERLGSVRRVAFDKTGTLTVGRPEVVVVVAANGDEAEVVRLAALLEVGSAHPLARGILHAAEDEGFDAEARGEAAGERVADMTEVPGQGVSGMIDGRQVCVGNVDWVDRSAAMQQPAEELAVRGMSVVAVALADANGVQQMLGLIGLRDQVRPEAAEAVGMLSAQRVASVMLTGDRVRTADAIAAEVGIDHVQAELLPVQKADCVRRLSAEQPTAMIGDGINDAPALATATVGIAIGAHGSAAAIESAEVTFVGDDLRLIPPALQHAKRARRIMTTNLVMALCVIAGLMPLALCGVLGLAQVVLIHELAEVVIIANGMRAARR
ncbi:heavy metal translocating P-type ATPase [Pseudoclavibacter soli]|uniref:heavy metal translocating P-type ATPase n=1 Tax=Pseudoclavibacter soli TaxID=452623 RepID=UPI00042287FA|nr:cation-translocating P-type ATPase [Pseudoclavibacter soli]